MGKNLALNMADNGYRVCVYNRTTSNEFLLQGINQYDLSVELKLKAY